MISLSKFLNVLFVNFANFQRFRIDYVTILISVKICVRKYEFQFVFLDARDMTNECLR
jgi:hypothetical protein